MELDNVIHKKDTAHTMRFLLFLFIFFSCINASVKKNSFLIIESKLSHNKPFPVLVIGTKDYPVTYRYSRNFIVSYKQMKDFQKCVSIYCDTFIVGKYPVYQITTISAERNRIFFINKIDRAKSFFKCLDDVCDRNKLVDARHVIDHLLLRLDDY